MRITFGCSLLPTTVFARSQATALFGGLKVESDTVQFGDKSKNYSDREKKKRPGDPKFLKKKQSPKKTEQTLLQWQDGTFDKKPEGSEEDFRDKDPWFNQTPYKTT